MPIFQKTARAKSRRPINLALQGGGAHGAFTWGVLDRLLQDDGFEIGWVSGTSAGAVSAVALAEGLRLGGRAGAREKLNQVWEAIEKAGNSDVTRLNPWLLGFHHFEEFARAAVQQLAGMMSPYEFNPLDINPLRTLLAGQIDFEALRRDPKIDLLIAATDIATGRAKLFRSGELTIDMVLASAALPTVFRPVLIDGVSYWDGGFSANPEFLTIARESPVDDTLIVLLSALAKDSAAITLPEISDEVARITFNQPFLAGIAQLAAAREGSGGVAGRLRSPERKKLSGHRFHLIEAGSHTSDLGLLSKIGADGALLERLRLAGVAEAEIWLKEFGHAVGARETINISDIERKRPRNKIA